MKIYCRVDCGAYSTPEVFNKIVDLELPRVKRRLCLVVGEEEYIAKGRRLALTDVLGILTGLCLDNDLKGEIELLDTPLGKVYEKRSKLLSEQGPHLNPKTYQFLRPKLFGTVADSLDLDSLRVAAWTLAIDYARPVARV